MDKTPSPAMHDNLPWWRERMVWLIIALPLSAVVAGIATVFIAAHDPDDLVKEQYSKTGMTVNAADDADRMAARMGLVAQAQYRGDVLEVVLGGNLPSEQKLVLHVVHPTRADMDTQIPLLPVGQGKYQARTLLQGQGNRYITLEPTSQEWRLRGEWRAPFDEEMSLRPTGVQNPSTHP